MSRHRLASRLVPRVAALVMPAALVVLPPDALRHARTPARTGGTFTMTYSQQQVTALGDREGHIVIAGRATGTGHSTGAAPFMDGAEITQVALTELSKGNGPDQGYIIETKNGEVAATRYAGSVKTVPGPDGKPIMTFEGTWTKLGGSGRYAGVTGAGRYRGRMTAPNASVIEWEGEMQLRK